MGKKKEKPVYFDDGRTLADMSGVRSGITGRLRKAAGSGTSFKEAWRTYWAAFRMMLLPTLVLCGALILIFALLTLIFWLA